VGQEIQDKWSCFTTSTQTEEEEGEGRRGGNERGRKRKEQERLLMQKFNRLNSITGDE